MSEFLPVQGLVGIVSDYLGICRETLVHTSPPTIDLFFAPVSDGSNVWFPGTPYYRRGNLDKQNVTLSETGEEKDETSFWQPVETGVVYPSRELFHHFREDQAEYLNYLYASQTAICSDCVVVAGYRNSSASWSTDVSRLETYQTQWKSQNSSRSRPFSHHPPVTPSALFSFTPPFPFPEFIGWQHFEHPSFIGVRAVDHPYYEGLDFSIAVNSPTISFFRHFPEEGTKLHSVSVDEWNVYVLQTRSSDSSVFLFRRTLGQLSFFMFLS